MFVCWKNNLYRPKVHKKLHAYKTLFIFLTTLPFAKVVGKTNFVQRKTRFVGKFIRK